MLLQGSFVQGEEGVQGELEDPGVNQVNRVNQVNLVTGFSL